MTLLGVAFVATSGRAFFVCGRFYSFLHVGIAMCRDLLYVVDDEEYT